MAWRKYVWSLLASTGRNSRGAGSVGDAGVVACGNVVSTQALCVPEKDAELDMAVARDVRIGRTSGPEFAQEVGKHLSAVLTGKIHLVEANAEICADPPGIGEVGAGRAVLVGIIPVGHVQGLDAVAGLHQAKSGNGGVHATGDAQRLPALKTRPTWPQILAAAVGAGASSQRHCPLAVRARQPRP